MDKLLLNPIRLKIVSTLITVVKCDFNHLLKVTESTKGNLSVQLKKLEENKYININKSFKNNYSNTSCTITKHGSDKFEEFVKLIISLRK